MFLLLFWPNYAISAKAPLGEKGKEPQVFVLAEDLDPVVVEAYVELGGRLLSVEKSSLPTDHTQIFSHLYAR